MNSQIKKEINSFFVKNSFNCKMELINDTFNIGRYFRYKEPQDKLVKSNVVYKVNCSCGSSYIGQTKRNLITRLKEHCPTSNSAHETDVTNHLLENPDHKISFNETEILAQANQWRKLLIKETLLIQKYSPDLNIDKTSTPLYLFNT